MDVQFGSFVWDSDKERININKHGVDFQTAAMVFEDPKRIVIRDIVHSVNEERFFCIGQLEGKILMVRFSYQGDWIRIIGAASWRKWRKYYEKENDTG